MATKVTSSNGRSTLFYHKKFICDKEEDILKLPKDGIEGSIQDSSDDMINRPCSIGSTALVCSTSEMWVLSPSNEWVKFASSGSGSDQDDPDESNVVCF